MNNEVLTSCPIVKTQFLGLVEKLNTSSGVPAFTSFNKQIVWVRESSATVAMFYKGEFIKSFNTNNDFYGYLTSIKLAILDAEKMMKQYKVKSKDHLEFRVLVDILDTPYLLPEKEEKFGVKQKFLNVGENWYVHNQKKIDEYQASIKKSLDAQDRNQQFDLSYKANKKFNLIKVDSKTVYDQEVVWSSKKPETFETINNRLLKLK